MNINYVVSFYAMMEKIAVNLNPIYTGAKTEVQVIWYAKKMTYKDSRTRSGVQ
jgi:hypothetical protein